MPERPRVGAGTVLMILRLLIHVPVPAALALFGAMLWRAF